MVRTIKRASADDRWKAVSDKDPFSAADLESTPAEFTCSRGTRGEVNPAAQRLERHPVDVLPPDRDHEPVPRRLYLKERDFMAHGTSDHCLGCRALISGGRAQGHTEECRIRVEGELRKTEEGKACLGASRVGDTLTGRALKRVRFAEDQDDNNAEVPEPTSESASSNLPAEAASSSSAPTHSVNPALPASATEVLGEVISEGASSSCDAAVRLSMKRSSDNSNSESEAKRLHTGHSMSCFWMTLMSVTRVERCREVCRRKGTFLVDVNDWHCESRDNLRACGSDGAIVVCSSGCVAKELMSNESRLLDFLAAARHSNGNLQRKTHREVCASIRVWYPRDG